MIAVNKKRKVTNQLRIIGGKWRGRKLNFPDVPHLRPTSDRVRETVFNWLQTDVIEAHCLDLFAGSGALGFEALSRGAADVLLLDIHPESAKQLQQNCQLLSCENAQVIQQDARQWLRSPANSQYNLIFLDPPFEMGIVAEIATLLNENHWLADGAKIYLEQGCRPEPPELPTSWQLIKDKKAGQVRFQLYQLN